MQTVLYQLDKECFFISYKYFYCHVTDVETTFQTLHCNYGRFGYLDVLPMSRFLFGIYM